MTEHDKGMYEKGYRYKLSPVDQSFEPLYAKFAMQCGMVMRQYPDTRFEVVKLEEQTSVSA